MLPRRDAGERHLQSRSAYGEAECIDREDELVEPHILLAEGTAQKDAEKEPHDAADKSRRREDDRAPEQGMLF